MKLHPTDVIVPVGSNPDCDCRIMRFLWDKLTSGQRELFCMTGNPYDPGTSSYFSFDPFALPAD